MTRNEFTLLYTIKKNGIQSHRKLRDSTDLSTGYISQTIKEFTDKGWVDSDGITAKGVEALLPYKVDNAVIMAAGMSTRFVPISLEKPKGLLVVKNEVLIEGYVFNIGVIILSILVIIIECFFSQIMRYLKRQTICIFF